MKKKDVILFISIFLILALISGATYAYWGWSSNTNKSVVFNTSKGIEEYITYDAGEAHFVGNFQPSSSYCGGMSNTISFSKKVDVVNQSLVATIKMTINSIETNIKSSDYVKWAITSGDSSSCGSALAEGTFKGLNNGAVVTLLADEEITTDTKTFTVWLWIDSSGTNLGNLSGETIDVNVWSQIDMTDGSSTASNCTIYYVDESGENPITSQSITEGQSFILPDGGYFYTWDEENACANEDTVSNSGDSVNFPCGTILHYGASHPPTC